MTKQNNVLRVAIATMFAVGAGASHAALYTAAGATFSATKVASELPTTGATLISSGAELTAGSTITTFAPSAGQNLQINVALSNGAKFGAAPVVFCHEAVSGSAIAATLNLGGAGADSGTWTLASTAIGNVTTATSISACFVSATTLTVTGAHADAGITFNFTYGTLASSTVNGTYVTFARGVTGEVTPGTDVVAQVVSGFVTLANQVTLLSAGTVDFKSNGSAAATAGANLATKIELEHVMAAGSGSITVSGAPLTASKVTGGVFLVTAAAACTTAAGQVLASATGGVASVTFTGLDSATMSGGVNVCVQFDGATAIAAGSITASVGATAQTGYSLNTAMGASTLVNVTRNGTTLVAPLAQVPSGWTSRLVITNAGPAAAYTVTAIGESGNTITLTGAGASGTVAANSTTVVDLPGLLTTSDTTKPRASLVVTVSGTNANISGLYQIVNPSTGTISNHTLVQK